MAPDDDLRNLIQGLVRSAVEAQVRTLRDYSSLRELIAVGALDQRAVNEEYQQYLREVGGDLGRRITDLSARYYASLLELTDEHSRQFYERVISRLHGQPLVGESPAAAPIPLEIYGVLGTQAEGLFELCNEQSTATDVSFLVAPLRGPRGEMFRPIISFEPEQFTLSPGAVRQVRLTVALERDLFAVGSLYRAAVEVMGFPDVALALTVWAAEPVASTFSVTADTGGPVGGAEAAESS